MLVIRLARTGRAKYPTYRIVAAEAARTATGKFVAVLGHYNPHTKDLVVKHDEVKKHLSNGAQPSNTVVELLMREKIELPGWVKLKTKAPKAVETPAEDAAAAATDTEVTEAEAATDAGEAVEEISPALENSDERVAEVAEDTAGAAEAEAVSEDTTETAK